MTRFRTWMFDSLQFSLAGCLCIGLLVSGCVTRRNSELLEAQLRQQESVIRRYERESSQLRSDLAVAQREMDIIRSEQAAQGQLAFAEETSHSLGKADGLVFNTLMTAGQNHDDAPGDERFHAVFYPKDAQGEIVKLAGHVEFEAIDLSRPADQKTIGRWEFSPEESRQLWHAGFLTSGYQLDQTWKIPPRGAKILLLARLKTVDGRTFEATHTIPIEPPAQSESAPQQMPHPAQASAIEPVKFEVPAQSRRVPEPESWELDAKNRPEKLQRPSGKLPALPPTQSAEVPSSSEQAPPFPGGVQTSDNWTEEQIPVVR